MIFYTSIVHRSRKLEITGTVERNGDFWTAKSPQYEGFSATGQFVTEATMQYREDLPKWLDDRSEL